MLKHFIVELEKIKKRLLELGSIVEQAVEKSARSVLTRDSALAEAVIAADHEIDLLEVEIEEEVLKILALHQPVAVDLRFLVAVLKINSDLERVADLAVNIAERALYLCDETSVELPFDFEDMTAKSRSMLKRSLDALIFQDVELAKKVCSDDDEVDAINRQMYDTVYDRIRKNPEHAEPLVQWLSLSRHIERIADYATNICEDVIYMVDGAIVRHKPEDFRHKSKSE